MSLKTSLRTVFSPLLNRLESGNDAYEYKSSHRKILIALGVLLSSLAGFVLWLALRAEDTGYYLPVVLFGTIGFMCLLVGFLGSDRAVAKLWNSTR